MCAMMPMFRISRSMAHFIENAARRQAVEKRAFAFAAKPADCALAIRGFPM